MRKVRPVVVSEAIRLLIEELWKAADTITTSSDLYRYADQFPSPVAGELLKKALNYFSERKVTSENARDGKRIWHDGKELGFGIRLKGDHQLIKEYGEQKHVLYIGLLSWLEHHAPKLHEYTMNERLSNKRSYGTQDPRCLAQYFLTLAAYRRRNLARPKLPDSFR